MYGRDFIRVYDDALDDDLCDDLIAYHCRRHDTGRTHAGIVGGGYNTLTKKSEETALYPGECLRDRLTEVFVNHRIRYLGEVSLGLPPTLEFRDRHPIVSRYPKGVGHMDVHNDLQPSSITRELTFVAYLNDVDIGGETHFPNQNMTVRPKKGRLVIFPPFWMFPHSSALAESNDKYVAMVVQVVKESP